MSEVMKSENEHPQYTSLALGSISILIDQADIVSIESSGEIDKTDPLAMSLGWQHFGGVSIPVYCLNDELKLQSDFSGHGAVCAVVNQGDRYISLICSEALGFNDVIEKQVPLPHCMQACPSPVDAICLCRQDSRTVVNLISSAGSLIDYIGLYSGDGLTMLETGAGHE